VSNTQSNLYNLNIERAMLSAILFEPKLLGDISSRLKASSFFLPFHQHFFFAILELNKGNKPIDEIFIGNILKKNGNYDEVALLDLMAVNPISNVDEYVAELIKYSQLRELNHLALEARKLIGEGKTAEEVMFTFVDTVEKISKGSNSSIVYKYIEDTEPKSPEFMCSSWMPIPKNTITFFNAPGGTGKTWLALQLATRLAKEDRERKIFLWLSEDPEGIVKDRYDAIKNKILYGDYESRGQIAVSEEFPEHMIEVDNFKTKVSHNFFKMKRELRDFDVIILDPLLAFYGGDENNNSQARVFMQPFLNWCKDEKKTIIFLHHSKKDDGSGNGRSRGASALVDACRCVYDMDKYTTLVNGKKVQDPKRKGEVQFTLTKDNYGAGKFLDSFVFSRKLTPSETVVEYVFEEEDESSVPFFPTEGKVTMPTIKI